jgi:DNA modification methylase
MIEVMGKRQELVLDQYTGSANIGIACLEIGRNALLLEKDPDIYELARKNLLVHSKIA